MSKRKAVDVEPELEQEQKPKSSYTYEEYQKKQRGKKKNYISKSGLVQRYLIIALVIGTGLLFAVNQFTDFPVWVGFLIALNVTSFTLFGFDKTMATYDNAGRLPEMFFHLISLCGGSLGIFIGAHLFRHKIRKWSFMWKEYAILIIQAILIFSVLREYFFPFITP